MGGGIGRVVNAIEEGIITFLLAVMTLTTFVQVVMRYVFNSGFVWALELTTYAFAWLVLFGIPYGVKRYAHLGVDAFVKLFGTPVQRVFGLVVVGASLLYAGIMLWGSWDYVAKLHMIGIESEDLPVPQWLPMSILIVGMVLLIVRLIEVGHAVWTGQTTTMLADEARAAIDEFTAEANEDVMAKPKETRSGAPHPPGARP